LAGSGISATLNPWISGNNSIATVSPTGVVTGVSAGTVNITFQNSKGCTTTASIIIKPIPAAPLVNSVTISTPQIVTLNATGCSGGTITWYNSASTSVGTGSSYSTPTSISSTTTYSADCNLNACVSSSRTQVTITFSNCPQNIVHSTPITAGIYQAAGTISSTVIVPNPTRYKAANSITLSPGFKADNGVLFEAIIGVCN
jgi:Ig-like domain CHU_C associated/Bacterial Ig-like domain (group 2)